MKNANRFFTLSALFLVLLMAASTHAAFVYIGNSSGTPVVTGNEVLFPCVNADVRIKVCGSNIIKVWCDQNRTFTRSDPQRYASGSFAVENEALGGPAAVTAVDMATYNEITTSDLSIRCPEQPFRVAIFDRSCTLLCSDNASLWAQTTVVLYGDNEERDGGDKDRAAVNRYRIHGFD